MRAPRFWFAGGLLATLLLPAAGLAGWMTARRVRRTGWQAPVPVICCGNLTVGGAGKTTVALDLARRLAERGLAVHVLTRGYGGRRRRGVVRVDALRHRAAEIGDEALLLARVAPTWVAADRAAAARAAIAAGAQVLVMDDGLQNPTLAKDLPLLVIDGATGFGNGRLLPAGPLREPVAAGAARCAAAVMIGPDTAGAGAALPPGLPVLHARLEPDPAARAMEGQRVLAFAGIAHPQKFFATLRAAGAGLAGEAGFPDHHRFRRGELRRLATRARRLGAVLVTTPKDAVRLPPSLRDSIAVAGVELVWEDPAALDRLLDPCCGG